MVAIAVAVLGVVGLLVGSHGTQVVSLVALVFVAGCVIILRFLASGFTVPGFGWFGGGRRARPTRSDDPEYIPEAGTPSEETWAREQERYRRKNGPR